MDAEQFFLENKHYRLLDYRRFPHSTEDLYLMMCGIEQCVPGKGFGPVTRPGYHLHIILSGEGWFEANGKRENLHSGQIFLEKPNELTWYAASERRPWTYCWMTFEGRLAEHCVEQAGFTTATNVMNSYVEPEKFYNLASALLELPELTLANELRRLGLLIQFLGLAVESASRSRKGCHNISFTPNSYVDYAIDFMQSNYDRIRVSDIADYIGIDRSYFSTIFSSRVGVSPQLYLMRIRMRRGSELLINTDKSIKVIASAVGYKDALTFSKVFKSFYGVSPKHYRTQLPDERVYLPDIRLPWREKP